MSSRVWRCIGALAFGLSPALASASMFAGETLDKLAMGLAWFIVIVMPVVGIIVFWKLHILPEKIAEKRHHPQKDAIQVLCLLSLAFGGLLWPFAWLWAYTRPTTTFMAYGTEKHEDYFHEMDEKWREGKLSDDDIEELRDELDAIAAKGRLPRKLKALRKGARRRSHVPSQRGGGSRPMEAILLGIYAFFVWLIFIKLKWLPWNTTSQTIVVIIPIVAMAALILTLNVVAPSTNDVRVIKYVVQVVPQVRGRVLRSLSGFPIYRA